MGWMRDNRDALVITVLGGMLVTVGGGIVLSDVLPGSDDGSSEPIVVQAAPASKPAVITVAVPTPQPKQAAVTKTQPPQPPPSPPPPVAAQQPAVTPPPTPPPPAAPPPSPSPAPAQTVKVVTTAAGTVVPEGERVKLLDGRLTVALGKAAGGTIGRVGLQAGGAKCSFLRVQAGDVIGIRVSARGAVGVRVVAVSAKGATLKAAAKRAPRGAPQCLRTTA